MCLCFLSTISWLEANTGEYFHWELKPGHSSFLNLEIKLNFRRDLCWICHALTLLTSSSLAEMLTMLPDILWPSVMSFLWDLAQPARNPSCTAELDCVCCLWQVLSHSCKPLLSNFFNYLSHWSSFSVNLIVWCSKQNSCPGIFFK